MPPGLRLERRHGQDGRPKQQHGAAGWGALVLHAMLTTRLVIGLTCNCRGAMQKLAVRGAPHVLPGGHVLLGNAVVEAS
jgi:hypothetical protein